MVRYCLELPHGGLRHFPAGTYNEQVGHWTGRKELQLMTMVHNVWYMFKQMKLSEWGPNELKLSKWLMPDDTPAEPTRRLDDVIAVLWRYSFFASDVMWSIREDG